MKRAFAGVAVVFAGAAALAAAGQGPVPVKIASDVSLGANFGHTVAASGDMVAVSAWHEVIGTNRAQGSVFVFGRRGDAWVEEAKFVAPDGALKDYFGQSLAMDGNTIVVGVPQADIDKRADQGAVYVFVRQGGQWIEQGKLIAPGGAAKDIFGMSLDISGDTLFVGAPGTDNTPSDKMRTADGAVHVFTRTNNVWTARQKLTGTGTGPAFGMNVALDDATAAISSGASSSSRSDALHIFTNSGAGWKLEARIDGPREASDQIMMNSVDENLALSGNTLVVGGTQRSTQSDGAVYVYVRENGTWVRQAKLSPRDGTKGDNFGWTVDISGDTVVAGAWAAGAQVRGASYLFTRQRTAAGVTWVEERKITAADAQPGDTFGCDVAISGDVVIVGAMNQDLGKPNTNRGAAYIVRTKGTK